MPKQVILINLSISFLLRLLFVSMKRAKLAGRFQLLASDLGLNEVQVLSDLPKVMKENVEKQPNTETAEPPQALNWKAFCPVQEIWK